MTDACIAVSHECPAGSFPVLFLQFQVSGITNEEMAKRRILRAAYPENAVEHPKRVLEMSTNKRVDGKARWNSSTQAQCIVVFFARFLLSFVVVEAVWRMCGE